MSCELWEAKLADFATERLDAEIAYEVRRHLEACASCRAFLDGVERLYALDTALPSSPGPRAARLELATRRPFPRRAAAWAVGLAAAAVLVFFAERRGSGADTDVPTAKLLETTTPALLPAFAAIRVDLPDLPHAPPGRGWLASREEAQRLADYSGKPLLAQYVIDVCPRCVWVNERLDREDTLALLEEFVCVRVTMRLEEPQAIEGVEPPFGFKASFPAMFVDAGGCRTDPVWAIADWTEIEGVLADYASLCDDALRADRAPLEGALFERTLAEMSSIPELVAAGRYGPALDVLARTKALGETYRTRFVPEAERMYGELSAALAIRIDALSSLAVVRPERAAVLARELAPDFAGTPFEARLAALTRSR